MPLHRSARLFTLGLALSGVCSAQTTPDAESTHKQLKQQRTDKALAKSVRARQQKAAKQQFPLGRRS
jgi:hypothetical protein